MTQPSDRAAQAYKNCGVGATDNIIEMDHVVHLKSPLSHIEKRGLSVTIRLPHEAIHVLHFFRFELTEILHIHSITNGRLKVIALNKLAAMDEELPEHAAQ